VDGLERLLRAAAALRLVEERSGARWGLGPLGAPLLASPGIARLVEHNALLYEELRDPLALLRRPGGDRGTALAEYWPYAADERRGQRRRRRRGRLYRAHGGHRGADRRRDPGRGAARRRTGAAGRGRGATADS
jgi:hypothetical protein